MEIYTLHPLDWNSVRQPVQIDLTMKTIVLNFHYRWIECKFVAKFEFLFKHPHHPRGRAEEVILFTVTDQGIVSIAWSTNLGFKIALIDSFIIVNFGIPNVCREGLSTRPVASSDEIQLRIDPIHGDLEDEITGLRSQVRQLRNVAQEIESEAKYQKDFLETLLAFNDVTANDCDESSSWREEQHQEIKQKYHQEWWKPYCSRGSFCTVLFLGGLPMVQNA
ncbi:unnamed protein product [Dovyalis caffra]|uniref:Uncharacterized protein n=1 Tax=Dovyalis caffra TaxID=77055 RepID=A0AAV1S7F6_9ROSI|nr:unnamed protein product [Dovyalis caffra]